MAEPPDPSRSRRQRRRRPADQAAGAGDGRAGRTPRQQSDYRPTQLSPSTAMRAREVATPGPADLAAAADEMVLVHRHYVPTNTTDQAPMTDAGRSAAVRGMPDPGT